jgi:hypothetical protein
VSVIQALWHQEERRKQLDERLTDVSYISHFFQFLTHSLPSGCIGELWLGRLKAYFQTLADGFHIPSRPFPMERPGAIFPIPPRGSSRSNNGIGPWFKIASLQEMLAFPPGSIVVFARVRPRIRITLMLHHTRRVTADSTGAFVLVMRSPKEGSGNSLLPPAQHPFSEQVHHTSQFHLNRHFCGY